MEDASLTQAEVADRMGTKQQYVHRYTSSQEPKLDTVAALEDALDLGRGDLLRAAGYVEDPQTLPEAIERDMRLHPRERRMLAELYRSALSRSTPRPRR